jgi:hypothetical protein
MRLDRLVFCAVVVVSACVVVHAQAQQPVGVDGVVDALIWGLAMPPADRARGLTVDLQTRLAEYRIREEGFRTALKPPRNASPEEQSLFERRVRIEREIYCLFPRGNSAKIAAAYASDAEVASEWDGSSEPPRREAAFIDGLLRDLPERWLAPYLYLAAGHRKLCASQLQGPETSPQREAMAADGRAQLERAKASDHPLIRFAAGHLLTTPRCSEPAP